MLSERRRIPGRTLVTDDIKFVQLLTEVAWQNRQNRQTRHPGFQVAFYNYLLNFNIARNPTPFNIH